MGQFLEFLSNHWVLTGLLVTAVLLLISLEAKGRLLGITDIKPNEVTHLINRQKATVLDVRSQEQYQCGHIINAMHTPFALLDDQLNKLDSCKDSPLIVYCENGQQSARACALLHKSGFSQLYKLAGGIASWKNANLPLTKG